MSARWGLFVGIVIAVGMVIGVLSLKNLPSPNSEEPSPSYPLKKTVQYSFSLKNTSDKKIENVDFSVYAPVEFTSTQRVIQLQASHDYELKKDAYHNQVMHFRFDQFAPFETRIVRVRAALEMSDSVNKILDARESDFLSDEPYIESSHDAIKRTSKDMEKTAVIESVRSIYSFVNRHIKYSGYLRDDRGALSALQHRSGDCTEYSYLVTALSRSLGIPARAVGGYVYAGNATFQARDYHNWAEVFWDNAWHIVDAQNELFLEKQSHFIAMRIIASPSDSLLGSSHQFAYSDPRLAVEIN